MNIKHLKKVVDISRNINILLDIRINIITVYQGYWRTTYK